MRGEAGAGDVAAAAPPAPKLARAAGAPDWRARLLALAAGAAPRSLLLRRGPGGARRVALTFDDGPGEMTDAYLDVLDQFRARASFFVVGAACQARRAALLRIIARGHELWGHGFSHAPFPGLDGPALRDELRRTAALLPPSRARRALVRPPQGATSLRSLAICAAAGYTTVLWSRDSDDCRTASASEVAARVAPETLRPGEIVLLHEGHAWTLEALPRILEALRAAGWQAVPVGEMLAQGI
jgi:peptidoglycan/xylan/chitin deacetylase (PgdA/CDA1 family)